MNFLKVAKVFLVFLSLTLAINTATAQSEYLSLSTTLAPYTAIGYTVGGVGGAAIAGGGAAVASVLLVAMVSFLSDDSLDISLDATSGDLSDVTVKGLIERQYKELREDALLALADDEETTLFKEYTDRVRDLDYDVSHLTNREIAVFLLRIENFHVVEVL